MLAGRARVARFARKQNRFLGALPDAGAEGRDAHYFSLSSLFFRGPPEKFPAFYVPHTCVALGFFFGKSRAGPPNARSRGRADELLTTLAPIVWTFFRNSAARPKRFLCLEAALFMRWRFVGKMSAPPPVERRSSHRAIKAPRSRDIGRARVIRSGLEAFNRRSTVFARSG